MSYVVIATYVFLFVHMFAHKYVFYKNTFFVFPITQTKTNYLEGLISIINNKKIYGGSRNRYKNNLKPTKKNKRIFLNYMNMWIYMHYTFSKLYPNKTEPKQRNLQIQIPSSVVNIGRKGARETVMSLKNRKSSSPDGL